MGYSTLSVCPERLLVGVRWPWWLYRYCPFKTMMGDKLWWHVASLQFWWCTSDHCFWDHFFEMLRCRISCEVLATSVFQYKPLLWSCLKNIWLTPNCWPLNMIPYFATNPYYDYSSQYQSPILAIIFKCPDEQATQLLLGRPCHRRFTQSIHAKAPARQRFLRSVPVLGCFETGSEGFFLHGSKCKTRRVDQICVPSNFFRVPILLPMCLWLSMAQVGL